VNPLERAWPFEELMLGQVHLTHTAVAKLAPQAVLAQLTILERLAAQGVDQVGANRGCDEGHEHRDAHRHHLTDRVRVSYFGVGPVERQHGNDRCRAQHAVDQRRPTPAIRDEQTVGEYEDDPRFNRVRQVPGRPATDVEDLVGGDQHEKNRRHPKQQRLDDAQTRQAHVPRPPDRRCAQPDNDDRDQVHRQQEPAGRMMFVRQQPPDEEEDEGRQRHQRGGAQPDAQQRARVLGEMRSGMLKDALAAARLERLCWRGRDFAGTNQG
jgi:hypothetical protein